jgi:membrane-bound lytic murein transglycosylase D
MKYLLLPIASGVLLLLCGCPAQQPSAPASASSHATAPTLSSGATAQTPEKTSTAATPAATPENRAQQDQTLIAASKKAYDTGMSLYQTGEYQAAREDFDRAVDIFLTSGRNLKTDSVLNDAFEQRVDAINALELDSLQQSNGFSQQDQTPVGVANDVTFPVDPNLLARAQI